MSYTARESASRRAYDVVVVGAGPNGLSSALALARAGLSTLVIEAHDGPGGGARTHALTLPGFLHDMCSSVHPLGLASPFFSKLGLERHGLEWVDSPTPLAHVLEDGRAVLLERSIEETADGLGRDGRAYRELVTPFVERFEELNRMILGPLRFPESPLFMARFGLAAMRSMRGLAKGRFRDEAAPALLAGIAAHAIVPLEAMGTASFALVLAIAAHAVGWPLARGGSQSITNALVAELEAQGGELLLGLPVERLEELPPARAYVLDVTPRQLLAIAGDRLSADYRSKLARFRYGPGVFKMDWALDGPIPWRDPAAAQAATVHLSGSLERVAQAERAVHAGDLVDEPFVILVQPTLFDPSRAPPGKHVAWAYCHVPHGASVDASGRIEAHIERLAPGFGDLVLERSVRSAVQMELYNPNYVGGDINGGIADLGQLFFRPVMKADPYATSAEDVFLCSSSTPPGGGVHGMCGYWAAKTVLARRFAEDEAADSATHRTRISERLDGWPA